MGAASMPAGIATHKEQTGDRRFGCWFVRSALAPDLSQADALPADSRQHLVSGGS